MDLWQGSTTGFGWRARLSFLRLGLLCASSAAWLLSLAAPANGGGAGPGFSSSGSSAFSDVFSCGSCTSASYWASALLLILSFSLEALVERVPGRPVGGSWSRCLSLLPAVPLAWLLPVPLAAGWPLAAALLQQGDVELAVAAGTRGRAGHGDRVAENVSAAVRVNAGEAGAAIVAMIAGLALLYQRGAPVATVVATAALWSLAATAAALRADLQRERWRRTEQRGELEEAQLRLSAYAVQVQEAAAARERAEVAGAVHDTLGHTLTGSLLQVEVVRQLLTRSVTEESVVGAALAPKCSDTQVEASLPVRSAAGLGRGTETAQAIARLESVEETLRQALQQVRHALAGLGPADLGERSLPEALDALCEDFTRSTGTAVELEWQPDRTAWEMLSEQQARLFFAVVREGLTNAVRHGKARLVRIGLVRQGGRLTLQLVDNGVGGTGILPGLGLRTMTERVQEAGGSLRFWTQPEQGFRIEVGLCDRRER